MNATLSVIIPALNEEANIADAIKEVTQVLDNRFLDYELLLFDDGSTDYTGKIMDKLASENPRIRVTHNQQPNNLGGVYRQGVAVARFDYVMMVPGDNENPGSALIPVLEAIGKADIVVPYPTNMEVRPLSRRLISRTYTLLMNILLGRRLRYYNGTTVCRTAHVRSITIRTNSFAYQSEVLAKLLHLGKTHVEVGISIQPKPGRTSKAFRFRNVINVCQAICHLFLDIHFRGVKEHGEPRQ